ncbi:MAG: AAA family ATPase [Phycisphaeraceae bacterium]|nr:AAA family ATPase [Phycisphaeraceae bacterium]
MPRIEGITIQNYRALRNVTIGKTFEHQSGSPLPAMLAVIGPNGSGKSTFLDAFGFLKDCLAEGVEEACERDTRGGFERIRTKGVDEPIKFEIYYREAENERPISYSLWIGTDKSGRPVVEKEQFRQRRPGLAAGAPFAFVNLKKGRGTVYAGEFGLDENGSEKITIKLDDPKKLAIASLGNLSEHPNIVRFREFLEGWYLSYFVPDLARGMPMAGAQRKLNKKGDNLANYVQFLEKEHPKRFGAVLSQVAGKIPGVSKIESKKAEDGRLLLKFNDRGYKDPFYAPSMSDGTLKYFAYMLLLEDPEPAPLIGIEEPENGLHHQILGPLATEMRRRADQPKGPQIIVTTHANYFVDALKPEEVFVFSKNTAGESTAKCAADDKAVVGMVQDGIPLGSLWYSNHLGGGNP